MLVLCIGLHPNCWAEQRLLFPASPLAEPDDALAGAESFENPCVLPVAGGYWLYCNVQEAPGNAVYRVFSADLDTWGAFQKCSFEGESPLCPAVYATANGYELYGITGTGGTYRLRRYASADGLAFDSPDTLYADFYPLTRPSRCGDRIYFGMENAGHGKIYSIAAAGGDLRAEKGNPVPANASTAPLAGEAWFDPVVFADNDRGCPIARLVYRANAHAYAYQYDLDEPVVQTEILEDCLFTEYLEEYKWREIPLGRDAGYDYGYGQDTLSMADGTAVPVLEAGGQTIEVPVDLGSMGGEGAVQQHDRI